MNVTFKNVLRIFNLFETENPQRIKKSLQILGIENINNEAYILDEITKYLFDVNGINLNKDDIDWWEFTKILDAILLDENSNMHKVMEYRNYEKPIKSQKARENIKHQQMIKLKNKYALPQRNEIGIEKLWGYLEKKVGEGKE